MALQLRKAERKQAKIKLGLSGSSGSGKTTSALMIAYGLAGDWSKIAGIDTENKSMDLYTNFKVPGTNFTIGEFQKIDLEAPFTPERYIEAIQACEDAGIECIIIDSISHEWEGKGGCLEIHDRLGGQFKHWADVTPRHRSFINAILQSKCHIITCARSKIDYAMSTDNGKTKVEKVGMKDITREGFDYELTADLDLDILHNARASKDRTGLFMDQPAFMPTAETGKALKAWCEQGAPVADDDSEALKSVLEIIKKSKTVQELESVTTAAAALSEAEQVKARRAYAKRKKEIT